MLRWVVTMKRQSTLWGRMVLADRNENGKLLIELCGRYKLNIGGTLFPHKLCHKVTWVSPNSNIQNQTDHLCITAKWKMMLLDVHDKSGADVGSDHHLLVAALRINMKRVIKRNTSISTRRKFNTGKLQDKDVKKKQKQPYKIKQKMATVVDIESRWTGIKSALQRSCEEILGQVRKESKEFISPDTWNIIEKRKHVKQRILETLDPTEQTILREQYRSLNKDVKREVRRDNRNYFDSLSKMAQNAADRHNLEDLFHISRELMSNSFGKHVPTKNKEGKTLTSLEEKLGRWRDHFMEILNL
jgi:hypothetical protein